MRPNSKSWHRALPRLAALALFLAGSNICEIGASSGHVRMACMTLGRADAPSQSMPCHHGGARPAGHKAPVAKSCCPDPLVVPAAPSLRDEAAAPLAQLGGFAIPVVLLAPAEVLSWVGHPAIPDGRPPTPLPSAPLQARAPPLS